MADVKRSAVGRAIDDFIARLERESENEEDFADDLSDFIVFLETKIKRAQEKITNKLDVGLIEQIDSRNFSSLVLRADCIKKEDVARVKEILEEARAKILPKPSK